MFDSRPYYAKSKVRNENIIFCAFDTETAGLGGDILCCSYSTPFENGIFIGPDSAIEWIDNVFLQLPAPCIHYAHFAEYDWRYILPEILNRQHKIKFAMRTDTNIYEIIVKIGSKRYIMRDSYCLYPHPLRDFAAQFSAEGKGSIDFDEVQFDPTDDDHLEYAKRDAIILRESLKNFADETQKLFGVSIGRTAAGTAMKAWQRTLREDEVYSYSPDNEREKFIRDAYYGGVVFLTTLEKQKDCVTYDINSSYPYVMETYPFPINAGIETDDFHEDRLAIYDVTVTAPNGLAIPILPSRNERGHMQWRAGTFRTKVTNFEIEFALEHGYRVEELHSGYIWNETVSPFYEFIQICKRIRNENKGTSYEKVAKLNQNSLYGKFGSKRERHRIVQDLEGIDLDDQSASFIEELELFVVKEYNESMACKPDWAVFITAYARLRLLAQAYALGIDHVIYGDTDSLTLKPTADLTKLDIGSQYGEFKLEKEWRHFRAIAPKTYCGQLLDGSWTGAAKGLPSRQMAKPDPAKRYRNRFHELYFSERIVIDYQSLASLYVGLKSGMNPAINASRHSSDISHSVNFRQWGNAIRVREN